MRYMVSGGIFALLVACSGGDEKNLEAALEETQVTESPLGDERFSVASAGSGTIIGDLVASYDMADYLGFGDQLGSIEPGKLADFFLIVGDLTEDLKAIKTISMVSRSGVIYFPSEIYPELGVKPFTDAPTVTGE
ncbi:MAG: amidohydrolase family protein [Pseudomonadota bacterium]